MITALLPPAVLKSKMFISVQDHIQNKLNIPMKTYPTVPQYTRRWNEATDLITWGIKWKTKAYKANGKNVLFVENGLYHQNSGVYCDDNGYFSDSSISKSRLYEEIPTNEQIVELKDHTKRYLKVNYNHKYKYDPNGPILVCLQLNRDASMLHHFPLCKHNKRNEEFIKLCIKNLPPHKEVILRVHPRDGKKNNRYKIPRHWRQEGGGRFLDVAKKCSALVVVNSTCATEGLCLGIPTATFGQAAFYGSNVTLDCSTKPENAQKILDFQPEWKDIDGYLCAILKHHLNFSSDWKRVSKHPGFVRWLNKVVKSQRKVIIPSNKKITMKDNKPKPKEIPKKLCDVAVVGYNGSGARNVGNMLSKSGKFGLIGIFDINDFNLNEVLEDKEIKKILVKRDNLFECYVDHKMGQHSHRCNVNLDKAKRWIVDIRNSVDILSDKFDLIIDRDEINKNSFNDVFTKINKQKLSYEIENNGYRKIDYKEAVTNYEKTVADIDDSIGENLSSKKVATTLEICRRCKRKQIDPSSEIAKCKHCGAKNLNRKVQKNEEKIAI
jgi:hypothetical protein